MLALKSGEDVKKVRFRMGEKEEDGRGDSRTQFVTRGEEGGIKTFFFFKKSSFLLFFTEGKSGIFVLCDGVKDALC